MYSETDWKFRVEEYHGDDWQYIKKSDYQNIFDHEGAAELAAEMLCSNDPDWYSILEQDGVRMQITSPNDEVRTVNVYGEPSFDFRASEEE